ncbi:MULTISPECIES: histidinol-phosphate transaminase [unclassified Oceanobacter]|uniref:histidinol-phosphate transaminase n=1 Tax=unclassified Oceanobacter TaxID=2620260 RepID=UPI0026E31999|nr:MULTISPECIES: histidinol-phosphate transaminase [unclassified Oceanobacter]MDO6682987.1 histidinol-phosphate transaminase [Oceanobacter sp. 5_MG-2023]MDP2609520.1 histidinol-phosphate transaminase [Oceanobacter sp. 1_MG-2023]MDP2613019.1 histidinol-phosphate transaminase [Oceanobacter sp. 2_MG-2023]
MSVDFQQLAVAGVRGLKPYQPGKPIDELAREHGLDEANIVKLASNENPLGPSPNVIAAIQGQLAELTRYPDGAGFDLKAALCERLGVTADQLTLGNGSSDILDFAVRVFVDKGDNVVVSQHAFSIYGLVTRAIGGEVIEVPALNFGHDLMAMAAAINDRTRVVFATNPNNPTGTYSTRAELEAFLAAVPERVLVLLDEAYFEYAEVEDYPSGLDYLSQYPNLLVVRTFSKAYGLASLRVGYGVSSPVVADLMNRVRPPFNVDSFALAAATAALKDSDYLANSVALNRQGMAQLVAAFESLGLSYIPSVANFVTFKLPEGKDDQTVNQQLLQMGVIIRPVANYDMPGYIRVSVGTTAENQTFIDALTKVLA